MSRWRFTMIRRKKLINSEKKQAIKQSATTKILEALCATLLCMQQFEQFNPWLEDKEKIELNSWQRKVADLLEQNGKNCNLANVSLFTNEDDRKAIYFLLFANEEAFDSIKLDNEEFKNKYLNYVANCIINKIKETSNSAEELLEASKHLNKFFSKQYKLLSKLALVTIWQADDCFTLMKKLLLKGLSDGNDLKNNQIIENINTQNLSFEEGSPANTIVEGLCGVFIAMQSLEAKNPWLENTSILSSTMPEIFNFLEMSGNKCNLEKITDMTDDNNKVPYLLIFNPIEAVNIIRSDTAVNYLIEIIAEEIMRDDRMRCSWGWINATRHFDELFTNQFIQCFDLLFKYDALAFDSVRLEKCFLLIQGIVASSLKIANENFHHKLSEFQLNEITQHKCPDLQKVWQRNMLKTLLLIRNDKTTKLNKLPKILFFNIASKVTGIAFKTVQNSEKNTEYQPDYSEKNAQFK